MYHLFATTISQKTKSKIIFVFLTICLLGSALANVPGSDSTEVTARKMNVGNNAIANQNLQSTDPFILDSLALVDFYNSTDGPNWKQGYYSDEPANTNWLSKKPLRTWHGVTVDIVTNRVVYLFFYNDGLNGTIPSSFNNLTALNSILIVYNENLKGNLSFLSSLVQLKYIALWCNHFSGDLSYLQNLVNLESIQLDYNQISGPIPDFIQNFHNLQRLSLGGSQINTEIPSFIGNLTSLNYLGLNSCKLIGKIPASFSNLTNLEFLFLDYNDLTGPIPVSLTQLNKLQNPYNTPIGLYHNAFNFSGLEEIVQKFNFPNYAWYSDQKNISINIKLVNGVKQLSVEAGGHIQNNTFQWYCNNALVASVQSDSVFIPTVSGYYYVTVANSLTPLLTLSSNEYYVNIEDILPPVPDKLNLPDIHIYCNQSVTPPTAIDNFSGKVIATTSDPLSYSNPGNYLIHWIYDDGNGNQSLQNQNIIFSITDLPIPDINQLPDIIASCNVTVHDIPSATLNCSTKINATTSDPLVYNQAGTFTITWHYDDGNGHTATQLQQVIINNIPVLDLSELPTISGQCSVSITSAPTATNCAGQKLIGTTTVPLTYELMGTYTITWKFDNGNGDVIYQNQTVIVDGSNIPPTPDALDGLPTLADKCSLLNLTIPSATDACGKKVYGVPDMDLTDVYEDDGTITWTFTDGYGNVSYQYQDWSIYNDVPPVPLVEQLPTITIEQGSDPVLEYPFATSHCDGDIEAELSTTYDINIPGSYILSWVYHDSHNYYLETVQNQKLIITGNANTPKPDVEELPILRGDCSFSITTIPTATSSTGEKIAGVASEPFYYASSIEGDYEMINWTYDDGLGNLFVQSQQILLKDVTPPQPDLPELPTIISKVNEPLNYWEHYATATDNCAGQILGYPDQYDWTQFTSTPGTYTVTWSFYDYYGNVSTQQQTIIITNPDGMPQPTVLELPTITAECSVTVNEIPTATSADGQTIYGTTTNSISYAEQGNYTITWIYDDGNGNSSTQDQLVIIKDITAPIPDAVSLPELNAQCTISEITIPTATDNCSGLIYGVPDKNISQGFDQGTNTTINWSFTDAAGNITYQTQHIVVNDDIAPIPDSESLPDIIGECSATEFGYENTPTATDNCAGIIIGVPDIDITTLYEQGTYTITWSFTDNNGNTSTQTQNVIIKDQTVPVLVGVLPGDTNGQCLSSAPLPPDASLIAAMYTDNCSEVSAMISDIQVTGDNASGWTITYVYDVTDAVGNKTLAYVNYSGKDNIAPEVFTNDISVSLDQNGHASITADQINNGSYDNCSSVTYQLDQTDFTCNDLGLNLVTLTVTDENGNSASGIAVISVEDQIAPAISAPADLIVSNDMGICGATITDLGNPIATDNCSIDNISNDAPTIFPVGTTVVTWTVTDTYGNTNSAAQIITVNDTEAPTPALADLPNITGECAATVSVAPIANDNCSGMVTGVTTDPLSYTTQGSYTITWIFTDANGNSSYQNQLVIVKDKTAPVPSVTNLPTITGQQCSIVIPIPKAIDNCAGTINGTTSNSLVFNTIGTFVITWNYDDGNGNISTQKQTVTVTKDLKAPIPTLAVLPTLTGQCSVAVTTYPTATDNCSGLLTATTKSALNYPAQGTFTIVWTYTDAAGNSTTQNQTVVVNDNIAPVPNTALLPAITGQCSVAISTKPTATDNCKGTITATTANPLTYATQGTYTITWSYTDGKNVSTQTQTVIVKDNIAPVPNLAVLPTITGQCSATVTVKPTATDNCKGTITATSTSALTYATQGTYTIVWNYVDGNGNTSTQNQTVIISDNIAPVPTVAVLPTITGQCSAAITTIPKATDNCKGAITATTTNPLTYAAQGTYTIVWKYADGNGNTTTQNQTVIVKDNTLPVVKTKAVTITLVNGQATLTASQVDNLSTDNCGIATRTLSKTNFDCSNIGANIVTLTVTDVNGNSASATATVTVTGLIPAVSIASVPTTTVYTGGVATNLYLGYGAQTTKLQVTAPTTGAPYTYNWTSTNLSLLSNTNTAAPIFTPVVGGYYSFTVTAVNKYGCSSSATINICVTDIRVNPALNTNVYICHSGTTMQVTQAQVPTYIKTTTVATDKLGSCTQIACAAPAPVVAVAPAEIVTINANPIIAKSAAKMVEEELKVIVMPNPTNNYFTLKLESKNEALVNIRVLDEYGRIVDTKPKQSPNSNLQIGFNYSSGIYFAEFMQGNKRQVIKLIKAKG